MTIKTTRFNRANAVGNHYILWMFMNLPDWFNGLVTTKLHKVLDFLTMKEVQI